MKGISRKNLYNHLLEKQYNIVEMTIWDAILSKGEWRKWSISTIQHEKFKKYAIFTIKGVIKCSRKKAVLAYDKFKELHGLTIKN